MICIPIAIHDGDTLTCDGGQRIRIAGIEARELSGACHIARCAPGTGQQAREVLWRLTYRQTLICEPLARSYGRVVATCRFADGRDLRCAMIRAGGAVDWPEYSRRYGLGACP